MASTIYAAQQPALSAALTSWGISSKPVELAVNLTLFRYASFVMLLPSLSVLVLGFPEVLASPQPPWLLLQFLAGSVYLAIPSVPYWFLMFHRRAVLWTGTHLVLDGTSPIEPGDVRFVRAGWWGLVMRCQHPLASGGPGGWLTMVRPSYWWIRRQERDADEAR